VNAPGGWWFPAKRYGWGWGPPVTWQGWVVLMAWFAVFFTGLFTLRSRGLFFPWVLAWSLGMSLALMSVCYLKGERPRWRWGDRRP
jgi:hypothetical protein